jgi:hypothetical protein
MTVSSYDLVTVGSDYITADIILWMRIPIDYDILSGIPQRKNTVVLWGKTPEGNMTQFGSQNTVPAGM